MKTLYFFLCLFLFTHHSYSKTPKQDESTQATTFLRRIHLKSVEIKNKLSDKKIYETSNITHIGKLVAFVNAVTVTKSMFKNSAFELRKLDSITNTDYYILSFQVIKEKFRYQWDKNIKFRTFFQENFGIKEVKELDFRNSLHIYLYSDKELNAPEGNEDILVNILQITKKTADGFLSPRIVKKRPSKIAREYFDKTRDKKHAVIPVAEKKIVLELFDHDVEDKDKVKISLNKEGIKKSFLLTKKKKYLPLTLEGKKNPDILELEILSTGESGDCTLMATVISNSGKDRFILNGKLNEVLKIIFHTALPEE